MPSTNDIIITTVINFFMKKLQIILAVAFAIFFFSLSYNKVEAVTIDYPEYKVEIDIEQDSTFTVTETITSRFYGEAHGLRRDVTLQDDFKLSQCTEGTNLTCGGFDKLIYLGIFDENDTKVEAAKFYEVTDDYGKTFARFEWELWPNGKSTNGEIKIWKVKYKILGGIGWINNVPYFYWNTLPEVRDSIEKFSLTINFPNSVVVDATKLTLYDDTNLDVFYQNNKKTIYLERNLGFIGGYTVSYEFGESELNMPAKLSYTIENPSFTNEIYLNNELISRDSKDTINSFPSGEQNLTFRHWGYNDYSENLDLTPGISKSLIVSLTPTPLMSLLLLLNNLCFGLGIILLPIVCVWVYRHHNSRGKDKNMPKTIIPLFTPPTGVAPYLLGSLKDEKVDREDIIGSIIDLAYRGYIKIKEIKAKKNYLLTKTTPKKETKPLNAIETEIMEALFGKEDSIETKDLAKKFPAKYIKLENNIYTELLTVKYFSKSPRTVRTEYLGLGLFLFVFGAVITIALSIVLTSILGVLAPFTIGVAVLLLGLLFAIISEYMPAKTELGSKVYAEILGFKMYLHTAERFRLQNLGPEEFERYLSYAIVFGIEKEWAKKFEGIYKGAPEWFDGTSSAYDALWISSFTRSFADSTVTNISPVTSGSSSGGGWSSGGSFGGFSGGGGGGGSVGGW